MKRQYSRAEIVQGRLAFWLLVGFSLAGLFTYGLPSSATFVRISETLQQRVGGLFSFRFILQPIMAAVMAMFDGYGDAKAQETPYLQKMISAPREMKSNLSDALFSTARIILLGLAMDAIFQIVVFDSFFPFEAAFVAILLAVLPYVLLRGPFARLAGWWLARTSA
jgi:hypothetical protein